ncbi:MAG: MOSC domain-containing protein [Rhodobacteraceae bacterium]|nr:MOSC domain-containing protein [Paracoccaceae bacterium]MCP5341104.1 MOSC domain-containing protein [Paracoccaceae bacterium]
MTGKLAAIYRHPLKSHGRERLETVMLAAGREVPWDRHWAVAHDAARLTEGAWNPCANFSRGAKAPGLMAINARLDEGAERLTLSHPERAELTFRPDDPDEAARFIDWVRPISPTDRALPARIYTVKGRSMTDTDYPSVSLIGLASNRALGEYMGMDLSPLRWRANLWVEHLRPFEEQDWIGQQVCLGEAVLHVEEPIVRCLATAANPDTGQRDADTLKALNAMRGHQQFGVYARVIKGGAIHIGDRLERV